MKKKIALVLHTIPENGGQHQYALSIVESLLEKPSSDYELVAICDNSFWRKWCGKAGIRRLDYKFPRVSEKEKSFNYKHPLLAQLYYTYMTSFGEMIRKEKIDILFSIHQGLFIPNYKVKIMSPVHDLMHRYEPSFPEVSMGSNEREIYMKSLAKYSACILADSRLGKKQFEESYLKSSFRKPRVISLPFIASENIVNVKEEPITTPVNYIFYPAQFWMHKNHINLAKAINLVKESVPDVHLILVGSEKNSEKEVKKYIKDNGLERYITILGFVSDAQVAYLYKHAVGMIMPSYFGPTNIPPLEAMALGCPVAVSNKYAMPEQVGNAGMQFNPDFPEEIAECIKRLWIDEKLRDKMRKLGYQKVRKWTKREFGQKLCRIIDTI